MKLLLIALLALATLASAKHKVVTLTDDNFDAKTRGGVWMIDVYAPWRVESLRRARPSSGGGLLTLEDCL
jgi:hypothetical protein